MSSCTCPCGSTTTTGSACCSIHGTVPTGTGFRAQAENSGGAQGGLEITVFTADGGTTPLAVVATTRLWIASAQLVVTSAGDSIIYRGATVGDDSNPNAIILGGPFSTNGGMVISLPWVRTGLGEKLFVKTAGADFFRATLYGVFETS